MPNRHAVTIVHSGWIACAASFPAESYPCADSLRHALARIKSTGDNKMNDLGIMLDLTFRPA